MLLTLLLVLLVQVLLLVLLVLALVPVVLVALALVAWLRRLLPRWPLVVVLVCPSAVRPRWQRCVLRSSVVLAGPRVARQIQSAAALVAVKVKV